MGAGMDLGSIEVGKLADLVVIDGNPLANVKDLRRVKLVMKDGQLFDREALLQRAPNGGNRGHGDNGITQRNGGTEIIRVH